ncbi:outer membrane lipoprotein chaperone LolA [Amphritea sp. HPY]|uniref:outer membrane lipoprotein chaperone LolA n=1 Tax=Amphritea sp. HPY TaxID=3421652 RepID=UPI003D7C54D9
MNITLFKYIATAVISSVLLSFTVAAQAEIGEDGGQRLKQLLGSFDSFSAEFDQISAADDSRRMEQSRGTLVMAKPNRFNWVAQEPFPQQLVSDGEILWIYDPDLEQATRRALSDQQGSVPALILNGQVDELQQSYRIRLLQEKEQSQLFELLPLEEQSIFTRIRLLFTDGLIAELQLEDSLGQRTSILFQNQQLNPELSEQEFVFVPPEGTDVIIENAAEIAN